MARPKKEDTAVDTKNKKSENPISIFKFDREFDNLIKSCPGVVWVDTLEEERFVTDVINDTREVVEGANGKEVKLTTGVAISLWSMTSGLFDVTNSIDPLMDKTIDPNTQNPIEAIKQITEIDPDPANLSIFILRGLGNLIKMQPAISRKIKDVYKLLYKQDKIIIITATNSEIPIELDKNITYYSYKIMNRKRIEDLINTNINIIKSNGLDKSNNVKIDYTKEETNDIINSCLGLSQNEIRKLLNLQFNSKKEICAPDIVKEKKRIIEKSGILEYWENLESMDNVGGLGKLKPWLKKRKNCLSEEAREFNLPIPRGVLIAGVPGCGKSLACKATASTWGLPLIRLDVGKVMGGIVGASEANMRKAIDTIENIAPACLWLDEIEKNLSGSASSNYSDSGTLSRVFGTFATWLQEKTSYVFVLATANDISQLPPELTRKGRLDEIWYVGLPTEEERKEIFEIQIRKFGRNPKNFDLGELAKISHKDKNKVFNYTGAEIEEAVKDSLYTAFDLIEEGKRDKKTDITNEDIANSLKELTPIAKSEQERIDKIIAHGTRHYRNASNSVQETKFVKKNIDINI